MRKLRIGPFVIITAISFAGLYYLEQRKDKVLMTNDYSQEISKFRKQSEDKLRADESWLTVVGLNWLAEGENRIGSSPDCKIVLPSSAPAELGQIHLNDKATAIIKFKTTENVILDGEPVELNKSYPLADDTTEKPTKIKSGTITFFVIKRKNGLGVRIKDSQADARKNFKGKEWFDPNPDFIIQAQWISHKIPKKIMIPDVIGNLNEELSPGYASFKLNGQSFELHPTLEDDTLFFVFRDQTSGSETYGASRFLNTELAKNGKLILDFNKAVNPPCAFTRYATCPMPPAENILKVAVRAGEKKPLSSAH